MTAKSAIRTSFVFLSLYGAFVLLGWISLALLFFSLSPLVVIYLAYRILKDPSDPPTDTFDRKFYEDYDHYRS